MIQLKNENFMSFKPLTFIYRILLKYYISYISRLVIRFLKTIFVSNLLVKIANLNLCIVTKFMISKNLNGSPKL